MNRYHCRYLAWIMLVLMTSACNANNKPVTISVSKGKHADYYHIPYLLGQKSFEFSKDETGKSYALYTKQDLISSGGQFELLIPKDAFPVSAPECRSHIILRMPWTNPGLAYADSAINDKITLFNRIKQLKNDGTGPVEIIIELNPYVKVASRSPLTLELTQCNVFFRHARGRYIDHL